MLHFTVKPVMMSMCLCVCAETYLYCWGLSVGLQLPLLLTCSTVELTSSWPTCSMLRLAADGGVIKGGLFSRERLLSARAAYTQTHTQTELWGTFHFQKYGIIKLKTLNNNCRSGAWCNKFLKMICSPQSDKLKHFTLRDLVIFKL